MAKRACLCCTSFVLLAIFGCRDSQLSSDLEWMDNTYNPHKGVSMANGHGTTGWYNRGDGGDVLVSGYIETFKSDECNFQIQNESNPESSTQREVQVSSKYRFNLRDLDPESIKQKTFSHYGGYDCAGDVTQELNSMGNGLGDCDIAQLTISTRNASPLVQKESQTTFVNLTGKDHQSSSQGRGTEVFFEMDDIEYAKKFTEVFKDAVRRCGGTKGAAS